jgi:tetratricopeptide (TPR) repeat protein
MRLSEGNCAEWLGDALLENGQIEDAIKEYRESIESDTEHVGGAWLGLAECYVVLGDRPKAREYATEALWHEPSCERARQIVAE